MRYNQSLILILFSSFLIAGLACSSNEKKFEGLEILSLDGESSTLDQYRGEMVFLGFWATWCGDCRREMPGIEKIKPILEKEGYKFVFLSNEGEKTIKKFLNKYHYSFDFYHLSKNIKTMGIFYIPQCFILDREGNVVFSGGQGTKWDEPEFVEILTELARK